MGNFKVYSLFVCLCKKKKLSEIKMLCILQGTRAQLQMTFILPGIKLNLDREKEK